MPERRESGQEVSGEITSPSARSLTEGEGRGGPKVEVDPDLQPAALAGGQPRTPRESDTARGTELAARFPLWGWVLIGFSAIAALLLVLDMRNRDRFTLVCSPEAAELHRGRRFPWPFGHEQMQGAEFRPVALAKEVDCVQRIFTDELEATEAYLDLLSGQIRSALADASGANLAETRRQIQQALLLTRDFRSRRKEAEEMLATLSYQEGKAGLAHAESQLRLALSRFQEAQKIGADRFDDLEDWIVHLEEILRSISPSPLNKPPALSGPLPPRTGGETPSSGQAAPIAPGPASPESPVDRGVDGGAIPPLDDASQPASGSGILM